MIYVGVDPGAQGGFAVLENESILLRKMPNTDDQLLAFFRTVGDPRDTRVAMEKVGGYVGSAQPGSAMFNFGDNNGAVRLAIKAADLDPVMVHPATWQKALGVPPREKRRKGSDGESREQWKARLKRFAESLFPWAKVPSYAADALLIAEWLRRKEEGKL